MFFIVPCIALTVFYVWLISYYYRGWNKVKPVVGKGSEATKVCVVIPARNEERNIRDCIKSVLNQSYPDKLVEIIVVDDFSEDDTEEVVKSFAYAGVKLISLKDVTDGSTVRSYKKLAITEAIKQTNAEVIITTDSDCIAGRDWIRAMMDCYQEYNAVCVAGPVFLKEDNSFFNELQALDIAAFAGITASTMVQGKPVLCNGANFAFSRQAFIEVGGYDTVSHITSGDDLLLLHKFNKLYNGRIMFCSSPEGVVETSAAENLSDFLGQRMRWASKSASYSDKSITLILTLVYLFYLSIPASFILSLIAKKYVYLLVSLLLVKFISDAIFLKRVLNFFNRRSLINIFLPAQFFHISYVLVTGIAGLVIPLKWKGRKVYR